MIASSAISDHHAHLTYLTVPDVDRFSDTPRCCAAMDAGRPALRRTVKLKQIMRSNLLKEAVAGQFGEPRTCDNDLLQDNQRPPDMKPSKKHLQSS